MIRLPRSTTWALRWSISIGRCQYRMIEKIQVPPAGRHEHLRNPGWSASFHSESDSVGRCCWLKSATITPDDSITAGDAHQLEPS